MLLVNPMVGFGAFARPATVALTDNVLDTSDSTTYTFTNRAIGSADSNRIVVVSIHTIDTGANSVSSATIGGISATIVANAQHNPTNFAVSSLFYAVVPTGTTATIVANLAASAFRCYAGVWTIYGALSSSPRDFGTATGNPSAVSGIDVPAGGVVVAAASVQNPGVTGITWTNASDAAGSGFDVAGEDANERYSGASAAFSSQQSGISITATANAATDMCAVAASWR